MPAFQDLTGQHIGVFIVLRKADEPYISPQGKRIVRWVVQCTRCGRETTVLRNELHKRKSCGCAPKTRHEDIRNIKTCPLCGKEFYAPPTGKKFCSQECYLRHMSMQRKGKKRPNVKINYTEATRKAAKENVKIATAASAKNPLNQRGVQNRESKVWILIDPNGLEHRVVNLRQWARENYALFDPNTNDVEHTVSNICCGFGAIVSSANGAASRKQHPISTYKGWCLHASFPKSEEDQERAMEEYRAKHGDTTNSNS